MSAPWHSKLLQSLAANKCLSHVKYVQLATVRPDGRPANRTVVFRGFLGTSDDLTFVTDSRSTKVQHLAKNAAAEVCWYFPKSREQFRLAGSIDVVDSSNSSGELLQARQHAWSKMSDSGRTQFAWPDPGLARDATDAEAFSPPVPAAQDPALDTFCLLVLTVHEVDYVRLTDNQRQRYSLAGGGGSAGGGGWQEQDVNP